MSGLATSIIGRAKGKTLVGEDTTGLELFDEVASAVGNFPQGMLVQRRLHATRMKVMSRLLAGLQDAEREQLMDFMQRMLHSLQNPTDSHQV